MNELFYILCDSKTMVALNTTTQHWTTKIISLPHNLSHPRYIGSCPTNNDIYLCGLTHCYRASVSNASVTWTLLFDDVRIYSTSMTSDCDVIVASLYSVIVYSASGVHRRTVSLSVQPAHALMTSSDGFIISHDDLVSHTDREGRIIRSYGGRRGGGALRLNYPGQLALDQRGRVFVDDGLYIYNEQRVVLLSCDLGAAVEVAATRTGAYVGGLVYDDPSKQLFVYYHSAGIGVDIFVIPDD